MAYFNIDHRESRSGVIYHLGALLAVSAWGASFISTKVLLQCGMSAVEIYVYRFVLAYLCTFLFCPRPFVSNSWRDELKFALCGICGGSVYFIAENTAVTYTLVSNVSLLVSTSPLITVVMVALLYKSERISRAMMAGSLVALVGVGCVIFNSSMNLQVNPLGDMLALLAALCWAVYSIVLRPLSTVYSSWFITRKTFFYGIVTALPFFFMESEHFPMARMLETEVLFNLLFLGLFCSMIAYLLWGQAVKGLGAVTSGNYMYFCPVVTLVLSAVMLGEKISLIGCLGCALLLGGVIAGDRLGSRSR